MLKYITVLVILIVLGFKFVQKTQQQEVRELDRQKAHASQPPQSQKRTRNSKRRRSRKSSHVSGRAHVIDGDSLEINNVSVRLFGIDAPEGRQYCQTQTGEDWPCGRQASAALRRFIDNRPVTCTRQDTDHYGRMVARCRVDDVDLNSWLVANGHALAYRKFTRDYIDEEQSAKAARRGIWRGDFTPPWLWRKQRRR